MDIVIASKNLHKIREIRLILKPLYPFDLLSLHDFPSYLPPEETGETFAENARMKALCAASSLKKWVLADDSGLVVPALNQEPGIHSAHYAGKGTSDHDNRLKLIKKLEHLSEPKRQGFYICCLVLASPEKIEKEVEAFCEGDLITIPRGNNGFGYDSLFIKRDYHKTFAQLTEETKNQISHRRKAIDKLLGTLDQLKAGMCAT